MSKFLSFSLVAFGGMAGSVLRYGLALLLQRWAITIPYGTLAANLIGCFVIGIVTEGAARAGFVTPAARLLLATGFCGGLTTMSSFVYECGQFAQEAEWFFGALYFFGTLLGCVAAYFLAVAMIRAVLPA
jgi:CrcB protein